MNELTVLLGGVRSGKSRLAVALGHRWDGPVMVAATALPVDEDMRRRIENHRKERPPTWTVLESPLLGAGDLRPLRNDVFIIVDCLTVLVSNLLLDGERDEAGILGHIEDLAAELARHPCVVVTNEVGMGVHPPTELGRRYRDLLGAANCIMTEAAEASYLVVAGKALSLGDVDQIGALYPLTSGS